MTPAPPTGPIILALDVGTTGVKAVAFDPASPATAALSARLHGPAAAHRAHHGDNDPSIPRLVAGLDAVTSPFAGHSTVRPTTNVRNR